MSTISTTPFTPTPLTPPTVLPIEDGDHMTFEELIRRWEALPEAWRAAHKRIELIDGVVRMSPPISGGYHAEPHSDFLGFLSIYRWNTPGTLGGAPASIILGADNMPEPDGFLAIDPRCGGSIKLDEKGYIHGPPELLAEIAATSVVDDLQVKKPVYARFSVKEYVVWRVKEKSIDWFKLQGGDYEPLPIVDGIYKSEVFPGLWLAASALIAGDYTLVNQVLQQGLASPEHRAFLESLQNQASK